MWIGLALALTWNLLVFVVAQQVSFWENETINHCARSQDRGVAMSVSEAFRGVVDESVESIELAPGANGFHLYFRDRRGSRRVPIRPPLVGQKTDDQGG